MEYVVMNTLFSISFDELCQIEGIESHLIIEIVEYGIVIPANKEDDRICYERWLFDTDDIYWIKKALRLYQDLEIDWIATAMVIELMQQRDVLRKENETYQRQLKRFIKN